MSEKRMTKQKQNKRNKQTNKTQQQQTDQGAKRKNYLFTKIGGCCDQVIKQS